VPGLFRSRDRSGVSAQAHPRRWQIAAVIAGLLAALAVMVTQAPASWLDPVLSRFTQGRVRLAQAQGTLWQGSGRIVLADIREASSSPAPLAAASVPGVVIPGTFGWHISPLMLLIGALDARLVHDSIREPVLLTGRLGELRMTPGSLNLPSLALDRLGSPWNTIRPSGSLTISWDSLTLRAGRFEGRGSIELSRMASALTPVRPLGAYRVDIVGSGPQATLTMTTLSGPLRLNGSGRWDARSGLRFTAEASADETEKARLLPLLGLMGRREGERFIIKIGA